MIKVIYNKTCGRCVQSEPLTSGMVGQPLELEYSADFDGLTLTAVFTNGKTTVDVLNPGARCMIPHEVLDTVGTLVKVGIYAVRGNELVVPTVYATIGVVQKGADPSGDISADPTLPVWAQIQGIIGNLNDLDTEAKNNLVAAVNEVKQTADDKQDKLIAGENITIAADGKTISATGGGSGSTVELDTTLTQSGKAADAKAVGDALTNKQDTVSDLETIRSGAAKGATALQSVPNTYRTAEAQDLIDNTKQDKLIAGANITIAADGKTISATGSAGAMFVTITDNNGTLSANKSYIEINDAILAGIPVLVDYNGVTLPFIEIDNGLYFGTFYCDDGVVDLMVSTTMIEILPNGKVNDISSYVETLPNPNALFFTGAVTGSYDGSAPLIVEIPSAVTDDHINSLIDTKLGVIENGSY